MAFKNQKIQKTVVVLSVLTSVFSCDGFQDRERIYPFRPAPELRMNIQDEGVVLTHDSGPDTGDSLGARDALIFEEDGVYHLYYCGCSSEGWVSCLAVSTDPNLRIWEKRGRFLQQGGPGAMDSSAVLDPWMIFDGTMWYAFYMGSPNDSGLPNRVPTFPYTTMLATSSSLSGPWTKHPGMTLVPQPGTYYESSTSPGYVFQNGSEYMMFFSCSSPPLIRRTISIARAGSLDGTWVIDSQPILPFSEQIENTFLYYESANQTWFMFTNHIGTDGYMEYTDAAWVYWTKDLNHWNPEDKAVVVDGQSCTWSRKCIGVPSVIKVGNRLALFYDAPGGDSTSHMHRDIGLAWLQLPLEIPAG